MFIGLAAMAVYIVHHMIKSFREIVRVGNAG